VERPGGAREGPLVAVATGLRLRGVGGRLTAVLVPGGVDQFRGRPWVLVGRAGEDAHRQEMEDYGVYGGRVWVKFRGVDSAAAAARFEGHDILMPCNGLVDLPQGAYYIFELLGMRVRSCEGRDLGTVGRVVETGGAPLLVIEGTVPGQGELLIPAARSICTSIDRATRVIVVDPPEGLLEL
jgi:16S rRNA processing protein RimM